MKAKLRKQGNSYYFLFPKYMQELINLNKDKILKITIEDNKIILESGDENGKT